MEDKVIKIAEDTTSDLHESENLFRSIFETVAVGVAQLNSKTGEFVKINKKYCDIVGYTEKEMLASSFQKITHPEDLQADLDNMQLLLEGKFCEISTEKRYLHKDGTIVWVNVTVSPMWSSRDKTKYHVTVVTDISKRKQTEDALKQSEERLDLAIKGSKDGLWDWDIENGKLWCSRRFYEMLDYEDGEVESSFEFFQALLHPEEKDRTLKAIEAHIKERMPYVEDFRLKRKSGEYRWFRGFGQAVWDKKGKPIRMVGSIQDINEQKDSEEIIRRYEKIVNTADEFMSFIDSNYIYNAVNQTYLDAFLKQQDEVVGHHVSETMGTDFFENIIVDKLDRCLAGETITNQSWQSLPGFGIIYLDTRYIPYKEKNGEVTGVVISARDITERKLAEESLKKSK